VDVAGPDRVCGWAIDRGAPETPVPLDILIDGRRVTRVLANRYRHDLRAAGILGSGCHAFEVQLPQGMSGRIEVRRSTDLAPLAYTDAAKEATAA
jgi:hypothetical protein